MRALVLTATASLVLAACGSSDSIDARNESPEAVAKKLAASNLKPRPGRWQANFRVESIEMPGLPPQAKEAMNKSMASAQSYFTCLTAEQADKPDARFFQKAAAGCTYDRFTMAGGKIDALMTCKPGAGPTQMAMTGTYGEDIYDLKITGSGEMAKGMPMRIGMAVTSRRVGECNGTEEG
jgi:hypothetical protein